ncbi:MAG: LysM peptidoglycan-binding domain-containing protein [Lentisphaeria bacterium]|nr:LysM peptidoglycan-binding domain-containing protein [Lentisphaeria bacterium]
MMKKTLLFSGAVIALLSAGCRPELAEGVYGAEEQQWYDIIRSSYPGYRPPRIASPATVDKASPEALEQQRASAEKNSVVEVQPPADDAAASAKVDSAADKTSSQQPDAKKEDRKADAKDAKAGDKKADAQDAKAGDKKADAKDAKVGDKKADTKDAKAGDKKADAKDAKAEDKKADAKDAKADAADGDTDYVIYKVAAGDTPGSIARKFYGKASMYEIIMKANPQIKDAKLIQIGTELKVPKL